MNALWQVSRGDGERRAGGTEQREWETKYCGEGEVSGGEGRARRERTWLTRRGMNAVIIAELDLLWI